MTEPPNEVSVIYDPDAQVCRTLHVDDDIPVTSTLINAMGAVTDREAVELKPLNDAIDPDIINKMFSSSPSGRITFSWEGYPVTVYSDGEIEIDVSNDTRNLDPGRLRTQGNNGDF